jgi:hypothetical protein
MLIFLIAVALCLVEAVTKEQSLLKIIQMPKSVDWSKKWVTVKDWFISRNKALNVEMKEDGCDTKTQTFNNAFRTGNFILSVISWV